MATVTMKDLAKESGLTRLPCPHCGKNIDALGALREVARLVVEHVSKGDEVRFDNMGRFWRKVMKARWIKTSMFGGEGIQMPERHVLAFHATAGSKKVMNRPRPKPLPKRTRKKKVGDASTPG